MPLVVDRLLTTLEPLDPEVLREALGAPTDHAAHDALAARVPALGGLDLAQPASPTVPVPRSLRIAAWNAERLKFVPESAALLAQAGADVALLGEVDLGMARSGNLHTAAALAAARGDGYLYGVEFVEMGLGDARETLWHAGQRNEAGFHGNAILSRFRLADPFLAKLDDGCVWFGDAGSPDQRRLGGRMALAARLADAVDPLWVVVVHLENRSDPATRAGQIGRLLAALASRIGDAPCVVGGDLNTLALPRGDGLPAEVLDDPADLEPLFGLMAEAGFTWRGANTAAVTQRTRPDGEPVPPFTRIDWLFVRGLAVADPVTLPAVDPDGRAISDHDLIAIEITRRMGSGA